MHRETQRNNKTNIFIKFFNFYIFSNIHVSFATFFLVKITLNNVGISENKTAWFVFFSTLLSYNAIRFLRIGEIDTWYNLWLKQNKKNLYAISLFSLFALIYLSFQLRLKALLVLIPFALATLFYVFPIKKYSLRKVAGLKLFLIAFSWAGITVLFPLVQNYIQLRTEDWLSFFQRFLFIIVITIPFDIRDITYDISNLKTLPQQIGSYKSKILGTVLLLFFVVLELLKPGNEHLFNTILISFFSGLLLWFASQKQSKYYSAFLVESLPIIWWIILWI